MRNWRKAVVFAALLIAGSALAGWLFASPVGAQIRAALVRDVDTPALSPVQLRADVDFVYMNEQRLLMTVPAGKRLVIESVSYWSGGAIGDQLVYCALRTPEYGPIRLSLEIHPLHPSADPDFTIQDATLPVRAYFEAGEQVWLSASHNTGGYRSIEINVAGYLITP